MQDLYARARAGRGVDGFDQRGAAAAFAAVAGWLAVFADGAEEIFHGCLVAADVVYSGGGGADILVAGFVAD
jgi:hypothetical protein